MDPQSEAHTLRSLRKDLAAVISQIEYHQNGHADRDIANAIYAAHKRTQIVSKLRERSSNLRFLIAAYEKTDA